ITLQLQISSKKDAATETADISSSSSSTSSTEIENRSKSSSTLANNSSSTFTLRDKKRKKSIVKETTKTVNTEYPLKKRYSKDNNVSTSSSFNSEKSFKNLHFPIIKHKEISTSTKEIASDSSYDTVTSYSTLTDLKEISATTKSNNNRIQSSLSLDPSTSSTLTSTETLTPKTTAKEEEITENIKKESLKKDLVLDTKQTKEPVSEQPVKKTLFVEDSETSASLKTDSIDQHRETPLRFVEKDTEPEPFLKSSKSRHVKKVTSSEESEKERPAFLKSSKSQHVRGAPSYDDDDDDSDDDQRESTNLQMGHVFVYMVIPPDGGYGWLITFISFLCQVIVDGIIFSIGIVLPHIAKDFNIPGANVVLVASMQIGFYFLSGTVSSAFINKFGFRPVALTGCLLSITVLTIATFSVNLPMMILFYSILGGPSLSMIWVSSQLIIGYYFDKYRPIANGASCSGAGAGIMIFCYMNSVLIPELGWRNLMRVLFHVGFLIVVLFMTLTFIEVSPTRIGKVKEPLTEDTESESFDLLTGLTQYSRYSIKVDEQEYSLDEHFENMLEKTEEPKDQKLSACHQCLQKCCPSLQRWWERRREEKAKEEATKRYVIKQDLIERQDLFYMGPTDHKMEQQKVEEILQKRLSKRASVGGNHADRFTITLEDFDNNQKRLTIRKAFSLLFDFRLLAIMEFRVLLLSAFLFPMGFNIPFVYSTVRVQIDASFAKLISPTIGFSNFAFRIASGFVAFKFREYTTYICGGGMVFGGVAVLVSAFYGLDVVWFQFLYAMCYGIAPAFYSTLRAIIYVRSLGLDKLTNAFGLTALAMGMGVFIGTTAGGILNDFTGSYTASFVFAGICICLSGALKLILPYLIKLSKDKERNSLIKERTN
ncbi:Monocarboxylate transporter 3, partial [Lucilia cuprina]